MLERLAYGEDNEAIALLLALNNGTAEPDAIKNADLTRVTSIGRHEGSFEVGFYDRTKALQALSEDDLVHSNGFLEAMRAGVKMRDDEEIDDKPDDFDSPDYGK